jgi:quercetin dioxygenase-like cupin family protein
LDTWDLTKLAGFSSIQKVKKDVYKGKWFNIVLVCLETGQEIPSRPEPYDVCFYVIDGYGTITVGAEKVDVARGGMVFAPANIARGIKSKNRLTILGIQQPH